MKTITDAARARSRIYTCWFIFLGSFLLYFLFSHSLPITDPVESNYALTAKEMVLTSDWLSPRIYGNVWYDKPVFFYWLTALAFKLFGFSELAARLMPALFAATGMTFIYWFTNKASNSSIGLAAAMIMGTSLEYVILGKLIITDMVFFLFNSTALAFFYLGYSNRSDTKRWYLGMYISLALAVLTKGPIGVLLPGLVIIVFMGMQRNLAEFNKMSIPIGALLFIGITLPWYGAMYAKHGPDFLNTFFGVHNYLRATVSEHPEDNVIYYYIVVFLISMLPWSFLAIKGILKGFKDWRSNSSLLSLFCLTWLSIYFCFYSLMATKYITYIFPITFPVSILTALYLDRLFVQGDTKMLLYWGGIPCTLMAIVYIAAAFVYLSGAEKIITVTCLLSLTIFTWRWTKGKETKDVFKVLCCCQAVLLIILSAGVFPKIADSRSGKEIASVMADIAAAKVGMDEFYSTSYVYYSGTIAIKLDSVNDVELKQSEPLNWSKKYTMPVQTLHEFAAINKKNKIVIVPDTAVNKFSEAAKELNLKLSKKVGGYNYYTF